MEASSTEYTIDILPPELWMAVFRVLNDSATDIRSLAAVSRTCRFFYDISKDESIWKEASILWDPWREELDNPEKSWLKTFRENVFWSRTVILPPGTTSTYTWGDGYQCTVKKIVFEPHVIRIYIDERGSGLLGAIQEPELSSLCIRNKDGDVKWCRSASTEMEIADEMKQYLGWILYNEINLVPDSTILFRYGSAGYNFAELITLAEDVVAQRRLEHLMELKPVETSALPLFNYGTVPPQEVDVQFVDDDDVEPY